MLLRSPHCVSYRQPKHNFRWLATETTKQFSQGVHYLHIPAIDGFLIQSWQSLPALPRGHYKLCAFVLNANLKKHSSQHRRCTSIERPCSRCKCRGTPTPSLPSAGIMHGPPPTLPP